MAQLYASLRQTDPVLGHDLIRPLGDRRPVASSSEWRIGRRTAQNIAAELRGREGGDPAIALHVNSPSLGND